MGFFFAGMMWGFWFTVGIGTAVVMDESKRFSWKAAGQFAWLVLLGPVTMIRLWLDCHEGDE
jgi:hypothetical protein